VLTDYFEHVIQLPLSFHGATHSGRLMKVMLTGTDTLWSLWVGFFREHFAAIVSMLVLLPTSLYLNWRLASLLIALCVVFVVLTALVLRKTETLQNAVERYYSDLAERASDALGNVALVQSFVRIDSEVQGLRYVAAGVPTVVFAGEEYGTGSSRDWAAKGTQLLGIKAVIAKSFERIHRSNLVGMGVLPLQFKAGDSWERLGLEGNETVDVVLGELRPQSDATLVIASADGKRREVAVTLRIDTPIEVDYYRHGGILPFVLRQLLSE